MKNIDKVATNILVHLYDMLEEQDSVVVSGIPPGPVVVTKGKLVSTPMGKGICITIGRQVNKKPLCFEFAIEFIVMDPRTSQRPKKQVKAFPIGWFDNPNDISEQYCLIAEEKLIKVNERSQANFVFSANGWLRELKIDGYIRNPEA